MTTRRAVLAAMLATTIPKPSWASVGNPAYLAAARDPDGSFAFYGLTADGMDVFRIPLPARAHAGAGHPTRPEAVLFARRPGAYALVVDCHNGQVRHKLTPPAGSHINGHGVFIEDGDVLLTSEQVSDTSEGRLGLWDTRQNYSRIGEIATGGIGPHDVKLLPDETTIVVANGGIATDPTNRQKRNIETMRSNLCLMNGSRIIDQVELPRELRKNSIRHLAVAPKGQVAFAMQWQGLEGSVVPLMGLYDRGKITLASAPDQDVLQMKGYAGSISLSGDGRQVAITSPRGGRLQIYSTDGRLRAVHERRDICGLAPHETGFLTTDGGGGVLSFNERGSKSFGLRRRAWDNHIVAL